MSSWVELVNLSDVQIGEHVRIEHDEIDPVVVYRFSSDEIYVFEDLCSHADVKLSKGSVEGYDIVCRAHGARFDVRSGKHLCAPATSAIKVFPVKIENHKIFIKIDF